jgi:hypothetical protein
MPGFLRHVLVDLEPTFVVVGGSYNTLWPVPQLDADYWKIGTGTGWTWYLNRTAGRAALHRARSAHARVMAAHGH